MPVPVFDVFEKVILKASRVCLLIMCVSLLRSCCLLLYPLCVWKSVFLSAYATSFQSLHMSVRMPLSLCNDLAAGTVQAAASVFVYPPGRTYQYYAAAAASFVFVDLTRSSTTVSNLFQNTCNGNPSCELLGLTSGSYPAVTDFWDFFSSEESQRITTGKSCPLSANKGL